MKVLVLGATGATGRHLVTQALTQGHRVTALARDPAKLHRRPPDLSIVQGDVADPFAVERAVRSQDAVLCALGSSTPLKHDPTLVAGIHHLVQTMERLQVRRLVYLSFLGVRSGRCQLSPRSSSGEDIQATSVIPRVSRADLAEFMLGQLNGDTYLRSTPAVMY